jgi:hypothetical protein
LSSLVERVSLNKEISSFVLRMAGPESCGA